MVSHEPTIRILHVEDNDHDAELIRTLLEEGGIGVEVTRCENKKEFINALHEYRFDLIISDYAMPSFDGLSALQIAKETVPDVPFIFVSGAIGEERAIESLKNGAKDYVVKEHLGRLVPAVKRVLAENEERKKLAAYQQALQESENRYRAIFEASATAMMLSEEDMTITLVNSHFEQLSGYVKEEVVGKKKWTEFVSAEDLERMKEFHRLRSIDPNMVPKEYEFSFFDAKGNKKSVYLSVDVIPGTLMRIASMIDVTDRKRAEETIREQAELLDKAQTAISVQSLENNILYWNKGAEELYGWTKQEAMGKNVADLIVSAKYLDQYYEAHKTVLQEGEWSGEFCQRTKALREIFVQAHWTLVRDDRGSPKSILAINADITERKELESRFLRAQRMESLGTLAGGIAHDLNNTLGPIMMAAQILRKKVNDQDALKLLDMLEASTQRGAAMVRQVLVFARGGEGERGVIQVRHVIEEIKNIIKDTFPKSIQITTAMPKGLWALSGDATQLHQVFLNLCVNARDAMPSGGTLRITAENVILDEHFVHMHTEEVKPGPHIAITVSDTGLGISDEILQKIFDPFFTTKEIGKGTGLGLSSSLGIVKAHGGFFSVQSSIGKGTQFKVYLPAIETSETQKKKQESYMVPPGNGELILVVDDERSIRQISKATLETFGYRVELADDGVEAIALYSQHQGNVKVVLCDLMMPMMDGKATIRALRKINPHVRIIASSGLLRDNRLSELQEFNIDATLAKPYSADELLKTVHAVLTTSSHHRAP